MSVYQLSTPRTRLIYKYIQLNPECTQTEIMTFCGGGNYNQKQIYMLQSHKYIKVRKDGNKKRYSIDRRRRL